MKKHYQKNPSENQPKKTAFVFRLWERGLNPAQMTQKEKQILDQWNQNSRSLIDSGHRSESKERVQHNITPKANRNIFPFSKIAAAAAIILIACLGTVFYLTNQNHTPTEQQSGWITVATGAKEIKTITLPDGSKISLNNATTFAYRVSEFNKNQREVWLKEGEAFFDVTHNPNKPFIVNYDGMQTVVLGTSFNIKAYKALGESSVTVRTGKVMVKKGHAELGIMTPGKSLRYSHNTRQTDVKPLSASVASAWMAGKITFSDAPFSEIAMRLKTSFNTEAELHGIEEDEVRLTATFEESEKLETIADAVAGVNELQYRMEGSKIIFYKK